MHSIEDLGSLIEESVEQLNWQKQPAGLYEPIAYILSSQGKRIRPLLSLMACNMFSDNVEPALAPALALEVFHNFTLLHDDLMDEAPVRRGKESVHLKWNANTAILSGDAMMVEAFRLCCKAPEKVLKQTLDIFNNTAIEVCEGQMYDMEFENRMDVTEDEYLEMIRLKTSVLIAAALQMGALAGGASLEDAALLYDFGIHVGLSFQLLDDWLDTYSDPEVFGKRTGGDIVENKKTFLLIQALKSADQEQKKVLNHWLAKESFQETEKIEAVKAVYNKVGVGELTLKKAAEFSEKAFESLAKVSLKEDKKEQLKELVKKLLNRNK